MALHDTLNVAILPIDIVDGNKAANLKAVHQGLETLDKGTDIVVLPELFSTGYLGDAQTAHSLAEKDYGPTMEAIRQLAHKYSTAIVGSFLAETGPMIFNRGFFVEPNGETTYYDKRHLFVLGEEANIFTRGIKLPPVIRYRGWNISIAICYDLRFPVWLRNVGNKYDVLIVPANWPDRRAFAWCNLLEARAIENMAYVVGANRSGTDEFGNYDGLSQIHDYLGKPIGHEHGGAIVAQFNKGRLEAMREKLPAWKDADDFTIKLY